MSKRNHAVLDQDKYLLVTKKDQKIIAEYLNSTCKSKRPSLGNEFIRLKKLWRNISSNQHFGSSALLRYFAM